MFGTHPGLDEFVTQMDRVCDIDGEGDGFSFLAELVPVCDDIADQLGAIHALGKLALVIVACDGSNAF